MPKITADPKDITIESRADVDALLQEMFDYKREIIQRRADVEADTKDLRDEIEALKEEVQDIEEKHEGYLTRREEAIEAREEAIRDFAESNQADILDGLDKKTYETPFGSVSYKQKRFNFDWTDKDKAIQHLKKLGHSGLVKVTETVYKRDLKKHPQLCSELEGVEAIPEHDVASVQLTIG